jgi:DNA polymerase III subunit epsilon
MYAIVDIETTGGNPRTDKITEIAVLLHDGQQIVNEFSTLINPECRIPHHITAITGITNEMVANAPKFYEIAGKLVEITLNSVFVAHNVAFDYGFIRNEFSRLGYNYTRDQLCTVKLSRKLIPGHQSYSLGRICEDLNISINGRHRAMGDAVATAKLFDLLMEINHRGRTDYFTETKATFSGHHPALEVNRIKGLPEEAGVYYFYNDECELIYIGKSRNIKSRVQSHFSNSSSGKALKMKAQIADVGFETTGSELIALLKESFEIKKYKPLFNRRQRRSLFRYELHTFTDSVGYIRFTLKKTGLDQKESPLICFANKTEARNFMERNIEKYNLCQKLCGLYPSEGHCFHYEIGACKGACIGKESPDSYNLRAEKVKNSCRFDVRNLLIIDTGRNAEEKSVVKIEHGKYIGYGYVAPSFASGSQDILHDCIDVYPDSREVQQIIQGYLNNNKAEQIITF